MSIFEKDKFFNISLFEIEILDKILISFSFLKINAIIESFKSYLFVISLKSYFSINSNLFLIKFKSSRSSVGKYNL